MINDDCLKIYDEQYNIEGDKEEEELLNLAPSTDILSLLDSFVKSGDIKPTILCYNNIEKNFLEKNQSQFRGISIVTLKDILNMLYLLLNLRNMIVI